MAAEVALPKSAIAETSSATVNASVAVFSAPISTPMATAIPRPRVAVTCSVVAALERRASERVSPGTLKSRPKVATTRLEEAIATAGT